MKSTMFFSLVLFFGAALGGAPDTVWTRVYGGASEDVGRAMRLTSDGGCIIVGYTRSFGAGGSDVWLVKADSLGDTMWTRTYGGPLDDDAYAVDVAWDDGYIVAGMTRSFGAGGADIWVLKVNVSGDTEWTRTFGDTLDDVGYAVRRTTDSGCVIAADITAPDQPTVVYLVKIYSSGMAWFWNCPPGVHPKAVLQNSDGGYTVAARFVSGGLEYPWLARTDSSGGIVWSRPSGSIGLNDIQLRPEGGYILTGTVSPGPAIFWLGAMDSLGRELWGRFYADGTARSIAPINGGGYVATGNAYGSRQDVYLVRTDSSGDSLWSMLVGGESDDIGYEVEQTPDHGFLVMGSTRSFGAGGTDAWLLRLGPEQNGVEETPCAEVRTPDARPTVARCVLFVPLHLSTPSSLLSVDGRKAMDLQAGANDISAIAPGIYFIVTPSFASSPREGEKAGVRGRAGSAGKVVIAR